MNTPAGEISLRDKFNGSKAAMMISQITDLHAHLGVPGVELGSAPLPKFGDKKVAFAVGHNFVIPRPKKVNPEQINATLKFVKWMTENSFEYAKVGQVRPELSKAMGAQQTAEQAIAEMAARTNKILQK